MRIVQVIQKSQLRGAEIFACMLSNELIKLGHEVTLVCLYDGNDKLPFHGNKIFLSLSKVNRFWEFSGWYKLFKLILNQRADIVQANAADTLKFTSISKSIFFWSTPIVYRNASMISQYLKNDISKWINRLLFSKVTCVISVSQSTCDDFCSLFPFLSIKTQIIPIAIELPKSVKMKQKEIAPIIIHIGGFTFEKNHSKLILIFKKIKSKYRNAALWLIGDGLLRHKIEELVFEMGLKESVIFFGNRRDVDDLLIQGDILFLPSIIEGLPSVILEAFAHKIPVVASNVGGISEIVRHRETGWLINGHGVDDFLLAADEVLSNSDDVDQILNKAYDLATNQYIINNITLQFVEVYRKLAL